MHWREKEVSRQNEMKINGGSIRKPSGEPESLILGELLRDKLENTAEIDRGFEMVACGK